MFLFLLAHLYVTPIFSETNLGMQPIQNGVPVSSLPVSSKPSVLDGLILNFKLRLPQ